MKAERTDEPHHSDHSQSLEPLRCFNFKPSTLNTVTIERFIHHVRVEQPPATEAAAEARTRLADKFPRTALRRMTHLGMLLGSTLDGIALGAGGRGRVCVQLC